MQNASLSAVKHWVGEYRRRRAAACELRDDAEVDRMARELGMSPRELRSLAAKGPEATQLLNARIAALGLGDTDLTSAGLETTRDLQRSCSLCKDHQRCRRDLEGHDRSDAWLSYCLNAPTLQALLAMRPQPSTRSSLTWPPSFIQQRAYR